MHVLWWLHGVDELHLPELRRRAGAAAQACEFGAVNWKLVPDDFVVPLELRTERFILRPLTIHDVIKDYDAMMSRGSATEGLTLEQNLMDLGWHQVEFQRRSSFTYTMMEPDERRCLGCVYIYPSRTEGMDVDVRMWVRGEEKETGLDALLFDTVRQWMERDWCFANVAYPGREGASTQAT